MSIHMRTKTSKNDTKTIKSDAVSSKNVKNEYGFVLPSLTFGGSNPSGAIEKADRGPKWRQKAPKNPSQKHIYENKNETYIKNRNKG